MSRALDALLRPPSIAIPGASADFQKLNGRTLKALIDKGYAGEIYPVSPKYREIAGLRCYSDVMSFPAVSTSRLWCCRPGRQVPRTLLTLGEH